jgi:hypothetical protein
VIRADEPFLASAWASFDRLSAAQQAEHLAAPLGKVQDVLGRRVLRAVLGQSKPKMTIARAIHCGKVVIIRLSPGQLGAPTAQLLGGLAVYEMYQAVMGRQPVAPSARQPYGVYVDEPAVMRHLPIPLDSLYELARGLGVGITTATQSLSHLPSELQRALLTNAATIATFRAGHDDARLIARELLGVSAEQVQHLGQYEIALRLGLKPGQVASVATVRTLELPAASANPDAIRDLAARRFGASSEADERSSDRDAQGDLPSDDIPLGRRRRTR